jgi:predicted Fe-Mo cluster-binding NifX family protein
MDKVIMIIGLSILDNRIAPVFDVARELLLVDVDNGKVIQQELLILPKVAREKMVKLVDLGVNELLCGAISKELKNSTVQCGIEVISFLSGDVKMILNAWLSDGLSNMEFSMPGCRRKQGRGHGCQKRFRHGNEQCRQSKGFGDIAQIQNK